MVSRILHLLVIDILAVGVAMRRHSVDEALPEGSTGEGVVKPSAESDTMTTAEKAAARSAAPGVSLASPLARLTSHSR
jgi:glucokinase